MVQGKQRRSEPQTDQERLESYWRSLTAQERAETETIGRVFDTADGQALLRLWEQQYLLALTGPEISDRALWHRAGSADVVRHVRARHQLYRYRHFGERAPFGLPNDGDDGADPDDDGSDDDPDGRTA